MSFYTRFADTEPLLTSTTTTVMLAADNLLAFSNTDNRYHKTTLTGIAPFAGGYTPITTSTSTAAPIPATPGSVVITAAASAQFMLSTPAYAGIVMNFFNASSTSTWTAVMSESTAVVFFGTSYAGGFTAGGGNSVQFSCAYQSFGIVSGFSTTGAIGGSWQVTYRSSSLGCT